MKKICTLLLVATAMVVFHACQQDIEIPSLPAPTSVTMAQGVALDADQLFGIWEGSLSTGTDNTNHFEQSYRFEFQSVDDAEVLLSHWYVDATTTMRDSLCHVAYDYTFDGTTVQLTPQAAATTLGAAPMIAVHTGKNTMVVYSTKNNVTTEVCTLTRTSDPEPSVTGVNRTLPQVGERITVAGRNLQFVDHIYLPTTDGEQEVTDFTATSRQIQFIIPDVALRAGSIRFEASGAHVSAYSPVMFCSNGVFFHNFSTQGTKAPYTGTEFENTINITQSLFDKVTVVAADQLPAGHALSMADAAVVHPDTMLCFFGDTPVAWAVDSSLDPGTGMLRFSFGDRLQYVIDHSGGLITAQSKCQDVAIQMDIYVYSDGQPVWNTGFMSFRLDKDQGKSLTQSWFAQTAMWTMDTPVTFADGWQTFTIPLSAFRVTESETYETVGKLANYLTSHNKQAIIKLINTQLDATHPAQQLTAFQFCVANMRLVPYGIPASTTTQNK